MNNFYLATIGSLALLAVVACAPLPESAQPTVTTTATSSPVATLDAQSNTQTVTPALPTATPALSNNFAASGEVFPSSGEESAHLAVDGDLDSLWNSGRLPLGWFRITLDGHYLVERVELVIAQTPPGPTTHEVWLGDGSGTRALYKRFIDDNTEDGQTLEVTIEPPRSINEVLIRTVHSPSWVAWREVRVFGASSVNPRPPPLRLSRIAAGLNLPVQLTHAGDGSGRLFVVEQGGASALSGTPRRPTATRRGL